MNPACVVAMLAIIKMGGIFPPLFSGYGAEAIVTRLVDAGAKDPLMIIYTSGTTGKPKGTVHTHCGFPVKAAQDMAHGLDLHPDEVLYWMTDMGWMMGPWLWLFRIVGGGRLPIINYSGGTEVAGGIVMGNVLTPLKPCVMT